MARRIGVGVHDIILRLLGGAARRKSEASSAAAELRIADVAHVCGRPVGLCGQRPSDDPDFTEFLVRAGIDSISVAPDSFAAVKRHVAAAEQGRAGTSRTDDGPD
ncbi:hypothetical protein OHA27_10180 [Streptomyces sp. NBC_01619]|uniref:PEP-binding protein n=1 Tax=Streptomyces pratisoli TaxID=3139917 RepID=A0ACC6QAX5_9ACTN|nr:putative PEP-binding protein [Streptomyces sp. NBC_01619]MCX4510667.1 hypothetical protein [Streptomyces sp. NBC_01619]